MLKRLIARTLIRTGALALAAVAALSLTSAQAQTQTQTQTAPATNTLPTGAALIAGSATVSQTGTVTAPVMTVQQNTDRAIINWNTFNVGRDASVVFQQPAASSVILNRVLDANPSQIFGNLQSNGQVFLLNPAGVWFGLGSSIDVGGLVATTHSMSNQDFMSGTYRFDRNGATGKIINEGSIEAKLGGYVALLAPEVQNSGILLAKSGTIALAAGETVTMNVNPTNSKVDLLVTPSTIDTLIENKKIIKAPDGNVIMSAQAYNAIASGVIRNSGDIVATGITKVGGRIVLGASSEVASNGRIDASSTLADGGSVRIDATTVNNSGVIDVSSSATVGKGGEIIVTGRDIALNDGSILNASGSAGGGTVLIGGDWQGSGDLRQANSVTMTDAASINASAMDAGNGGKVVLWSDVNDATSSTSVHGIIEAKGGLQSGDGGKIETSGYTLNFHGIRVDASAINGTSGLWYIDPSDMTITQSVANSYATTLNTGTSVLNEIGNGTINWNSGVSLSKTAGSNASLTLKVNNTTPQAINLNGATIQSSAGSLNLVFWLTSAGQQSVVAMDNSTINTNGGHVWMGAGAASSTLWNGLTVGSGPAASWSVNVPPIDINNTSITTGAGNISMAGLSWYTGTTMGTRNIGVLISGNSSLSTTSGNIDISGDLKGRYSSGAGVFLGNTPTDSTTGNVSLSTTTGSISVTGTVADASSSTSGWRYGVYVFAKNANEQVNISSTSGAITFDGSAQLAYASSLTDLASGVMLMSYTTTGRIAVVSRSGAITFRGSNSVESSQYLNGIDFSAQDATNSIRIGYDGTNIYSGDILIESDSFRQRGQYAGSGSLSVQTSGNFTLQSKGPSFTQLRLGASSTLSFDDDWNFGSALGSFTFGKTTNTRDITFSSPLTVAGAINVYAGDIDVNANLTSTGLGQGILLKATGGITQAAGITTQTNGGDITYWSNSAIDTSTSTAIGGVYLKDTATIDSRRTVDRTSSLTSTATSGGTITLGGGSTTTTTTLGTTVPSGYALNITGSSSGLMLGTLGAGHVSGIRLYSGGGDISLSGRSTQTYGGVTTGVGIFEGLTIDTGTNGNLTLRGIAAGSTTSAGLDIQAWRTGTTSASATLMRTSGTGNITLFGQNTTTSNGVQFGPNNAVAGVTLAATGTGTITVTGISANGSGGIYMQDTNILAASGAITLNGNQTGSTLSISGGVNTFGFKAGSLVTSSSSNISFNFDNYSTAGTTALNTSGTVSIRSFGDSFPSMLTWPFSNVTFSSNIGGLTLGKTTNTSEVTFNSAFSLPGSITAYGSNIFVNNNLTTSTSGQGILLKATNLITVGIGPAISVQTNNGNITLWADADGDSSGYIRVRELATLNSANGSTTQSSGGGAITLAGGNTIDATTGLPNGYAYSPSSNTGLWGSNASSGIQLGAFTYNTSGITNSIAFYSGGGNILMKGKAANGSPGISWYGTSSGTQIVDAGVGTITIDGQAVGTGHGIELNYFGGSVTPTFKSANTTSSAISISGTTTGTATHAGFQGPITAITSSSGGISLSGTTSSSSYYSLVGGLNLYSLSGPIAVTASGGTGLQANGSWGQGTLASSSSSITVSADRFNFNGATTVTTTGAFTLQPSGTSFSSAVSWPLTNLSLPTTLTGLTIGKAGNTANVTIGSALNVNGARQVYGGNIVVNTDQSWSANNYLFSATNDLTFNANLVATGSGTLTARYGQGTTDGSGSTYSVNGSLKIPLPSASDAAFKWRKGSAGSDIGLIFNNGNLGFYSAGQVGSSTASSLVAITSTGQLQQPNYYSGTGWYKLTFSSYPLNIEVGTGEGGSRWNGNTAFYSGASVTGGYVDLSAYRPGVGSGPGPGVYASGTIITVATTTIASQGVEITNRYALGASDRYLRADTSVKATSAAGLTNVGLWVGTQDDWVGSSDGPRKTLGSIDSTGFVQSPTAGTPASALRVDEPITNGASVLFYSTDASALATFNSCCSFSNATSTNPYTMSATTIQNDGSYSLYTGLGNLAQNQSKGFTWFYAAAPASQINSVGAAVASSLTSYTFANPTTLTTYSGSAYSVSNIVSSGVTLNTTDRGAISLVYGTDYDLVYGGNVVNPATANFINAGTYRFGLTLKGTLAAEGYTLSNAGAATLTIQPRTLTITGTSVADKVYNGNTTATWTLGTVSGYAGTERIGITVSGAFGNKNVGTYTITPTYTLSDLAAVNGVHTGGLSRNYTVGTPGTSAPASRRPRW